MPSAPPPWSPWHARLHQHLKQTDLLPEGASLLLGVSGGQDSLCLLRLLLDLRRLWHWSLRVVHADHRIRADSAANAEHVHQLCTAWGLDCAVPVADRPLAGEAAARDWRYGVLTTLARQHRCSRVVVAHTATDRAETLLHHLLRGSGSEGLGSLRPLRPLATDLLLVRPLLGFRREETAAVCHRFELPIWEDSTNAESRYLRNRIRNELLPYLEVRINAGSERHLAQTAEILAAEQDWLAEESEGWYRRMVEGDRCRRALVQAPLALQRRVLRRWLQDCRHAPVGFEATEAVRELLGAPVGSRSASLGRGAVRVVAGWLHWEPVLPSG